MVLEAIICPHCGDPDPVRRHGTTAKGVQRYRCLACKKSFIKDYTYLAYKPEVKAKILEMALNGNGVRDTARVLKISQNTVSSHIKKK